MKSFRPAFAALSLLSLAFIASPADSASRKATAPGFASNLVDAKRSTCHHLRWSSQRRCTSTRLLRQYYARRALPDYLRSETGVVHYGPPFPYYGYIPYSHYRPYGLYRPYWYRRPYWY